MNSRTRSLIAFAALAFSAVALLWGNDGIHFSLKAEQTWSKSCADITFGTTEYSSTGNLSTSSYTSHNFSVTSLSSTNVYCSNASGANSARIGKSDGAGSLTFTFPSLRLSAVKIYAYKYGTDAKKSATCSVSTSAAPTPQSLSITGTSAPDISDSSNDPGYVFSGLDGGTNALSNTLTIAGDANARFNLCKIVLSVFTSSSSSSSSSSVMTSLENGSAPITFNFVRQGNGYTGDCTYIKAGDNDILIDAGNRTGSASVIESYLEDATRSGNYVADGKLEYVIATHAHQDHIAGFVGNAKSGAPGGRDGIFYHYAIGNILDFSYYDSGSGSALANTFASSSSLSSTEAAATTAIYESYLDARAYAIAQGALWETAGVMWASESHTISLGTNLSMTLVYNYFYDHTHADKAALGSFSFSDQNDCSVCVMFTQGSRHFLFTGDAEEAAEYSLTKYNTLPEMDLFKGGHHGSYTANSDALLSVIKPKLVCVCCCAGNTEYASISAHTFPAQESIDRIAPYTDRVYVTDLGSFTDASYCEPMNGSIVVAYSVSSEESLTCSNNAAKLKDTAWFKSNRSTPSAWA